MRREECKIIVEILSGVIGRKATFVKLMDAADEFDLYSVDSAVVEVLYNYSMSLVGTYDIGYSIAAELNARSTCESMSNQEKIDLLDKQLSERKLRALMLDLVETIYYRVESNLICPYCGLKVDKDNWCWCCGESVEGECEFEDLENVIREMVIDIYFELIKKSLIEEGTYKRSSEQMLRDIAEEYISENYEYVFDELIRIGASIDISIDDDYL